MQLGLFSTLKCHSLFPLYEAQVRQGKRGAETEGLEGAMHLEWLLGCTKTRYKLMPMTELQKKKKKEKCVSIEIYVLLTELLLFLITLHTLSI